LVGFVVVLVRFVLAGVAVLLAVLPVPVEGGVAPPPLL
jgi:hypothetical protein